MTQHSPQPILKTQPCITRHADNPILTAADVPYESDLVFNAGVTRYEGRYVCVFRNDYGWDGDTKRFEGTNLGLAFSDDGISWNVQPRPCWHMHTDEVRRVYDPRLVVIEGRCYVCFAMDTHHGCVAGVAVTEDFDRFEILSTTVPDNRNIVLFPERIGGKYVRLERPFPVYSRGCDRFDTWISDSPDLRYWGNGKLLLAVEDFPFANDKIGPGAPPIRTDHGWLTLMHAVDKDSDRGINGWESHPWQKRYCATVALLDLDDPGRVIGLCREPLIAPEAPYETDGGFRNDVIFPTGALLDEDGTVRIYYGAADTVLCLATAPLDDLLALCQPV